MTKVMEQFYIVGNTIDAKNNKIYTIDIITRGKVL